VSLADTLDGKTSRDLAATALVQALQARAPRPKAGLVAAALLQRARPRRMPRADGSRAARRGGGALHGRGVTRRGAGAQAEAPLLHVVSAKSGGAPCSVANHMSIKSGPRERRVYTPTPAEWAAALAQAQ